MNRNKTIERKPPSARRLSVAGLLLPAMLLAACSQQDRKAEPVARPVKVVRIDDQAAVGLLRFAGEVQPRYETSLSFRIAGKLAARKIDVGDSVRVGTPLATLDPADYRLAVQSLKAQLLSATAERDFLRDDLARYRELAAQRVVSAPELDRHRTAYATASERAAALQAQLEQAKHALDYTELRADRNGVVTVLAVEAGQVLAAGQPVVKLAGLDEKEIHFDIPEQRAATLATGREVDVTLWSDGNRRLRARIREIAAVADPATRTYRVKATLLVRDNRIRLGMTATVWLADAVAPGIAVPLAAVFSAQQEPGQSRVWLVDEASATVKSAPVKLGAALDGERIAVTGLTPGQWLVVAGAHRLREGQAVRLPKKQPQGAQP